MTGKQTLAVIAIGLVAFGLISILPDLKRYIRISTM
jgi:hypothetical protein